MAISWPVVSEIIVPKLIEI